MQWQFASLYLVGSVEEIFDFSYNREYRSAYETVVICDVYNYWNKFHTAREKGYASFTVLAKLTKRSDNSERYDKNMLNSILHMMH